jgi:flagellar motility protein MotE (MotC chaperone)
VGLIKVSLLGYYGMSQWIFPDVLSHQSVQSVQVREAQAAQDGPAQAKTETTNDQKTERPSAKNNSQGNGTDTTSDQPSEAPGIISEKWAEIREKKQELARKEEELRQLEKTLDAKLAESKEIQDNIRRMLDEADAMKDKKIKHLIDVYSNMKAKQAALVLETLEEEIAVKILSGMRGRKAGEILSYVTPKKAALLSERLTDLRIPFAE